MSPDDSDEELTPWNAPVLGTQNDDPEQSTGVAKAAQPDRPQPYTGFQKRPPITLGFCWMLTILGFTPDIWDGHWAFGYSAQWISILVLVFWSFIGWIIKTVCYLNSTECPMIPGWFEVFSNSDQSIPAAYLLTTIAPITYLFGKWYFRRHRGHLMQLTGSVFLGCQESRKEILALVRRQLVFIALWGAFSAAVGRVISVYVAKSSPQDFMARESTGALVFDTAIALLSFFVQFFVVTLMACYFAIHCQLHLVQLCFFRDWLQSAKYDVREAARHWLGISADVAATSQQFAFYIIIVSVFAGLALTITVVDIALRPHELGFILRIGYCVCHLVPITYALWQAASVSSEMENMLVVVNRLPIRERVEETAFLNSFFTASIQSGSSGFSLMGIVIRRSFFARLVYLLAVLISSLIQYVSTHG